MTKDQNSSPILSFNIDSIFLQSNLNVGAKS